MRCETSKSLHRGPCADDFVWSSRHLMSFLNCLELIAAMAGVAVAIIVTVSPRFGAASWTLGLFLLLGSVSAGLLGLAPMTGMSLPRSAFLSFESLLLCSAAGCLASCSLGRPDYIRQLKTKRWSCTTIVVTLAAFVAGLYVYHPIKPEHALIALGPVG